MLSPTPTVHERLNADSWIMLLQHTEKKENSSSKRYEMSKWSFGDAVLVTD